MDVMNSDNQIHNVLYLSKNFCEKLVEQSVTSSFYVVNYISRFLNNLSILLSCKRPSVEEVSFDVAIELEKQVLNCFHFHDKFFFYFCEQYCENFDLVKSVPIFDGHVKELQKFVELIR